MKIWHLADPQDSRFARASRRGSWSPSAGLCAECGASSEQRIQPLVMEWEPDSELIGDFTWPGFGSDVAVTERVVKALRNFGGFELGIIEMIQDPNLKRPSRSRRGKPRVWLPYQGPQLWDLWVARAAHIDLEKSSVRLERECKTCGLQRYAVDGIERRESDWHKEQRKLVKTHVPRSQGFGLYIAENALTEGAIFRTHEFPAWVLCSNPVKALIEKEGFTNVRFLEVGETF